MPSTRPTLGVSVWPDFDYDASGAGPLGGGYISLTRRERTTSPLSRKSLLVFSTMGFFIVNLSPFHARVAHVDETTLSGRRPLSASSANLIRRAWTAAASPWCTCAST